MILPTASFKKVFLFAVMVFLLTGCAGNENSVMEEGTPIPIQNEKTAVASWEEKGAEFYSLSTMLGDNLYFVEMKWDENTKKSLDTFICRKQRGQEAEKLTGFGEAELICYTVDEGGAVYCLYAENEGEEPEYFMRKASVEGAVIYNTPILPENGVQEKALSRLGTVFEGEADETGKVCFVNASGDMYLFDEKGGLVCIGNAPWDESSYGGRAGLVNAGEDGIFTYTVEARTVIIQKLDMSDGGLGNALKVQVETPEAQTELPVVMPGSGPQIGTASLELLSGYESGVLIFDSDALWAYQVSEGELVKKLGWGDSTVNLKNYTIEALGILQDGSMYIRAYQSREDRGNVSVVFKDSWEIQEKRKVTLTAVGTAGYEHWNTELENMINAFNQANTEYEAELLTYESDFEMNMALLKGQGADVIDLSRLDMDVFARKGIMEDLSPYFEKSEVVKEADLVPSVRRAGTIDEKLVCVFPYFCVRGFWVEKGTTQNGGWTAEEYIAMAENHLDAVMQDYGSPSAYHSCVLSDAIKMDMDSYVNWEEKECYFDSDRFISLVNRVRELPIPTSSDLASFELDSISRVQEKFRNRELLVDNFQITGIEGFLHRSLSGDDYVGDFAEVAGYPNISGEPKYELYGITPLGMNSASQNKEGAWAFLEYILSEEYQSEVMEFSPRQDCFDRQLAKTEAYGGYLQIDLTQEERDFIREVVDNAYYCTGEMSGGEFGKIIGEELWPVWAGDKTPEEAVKIIQSRATLLVNE